MKTTENDATAIRIARQSQLERSLEYFTLTGIQPTLADWVRTADALSLYVTNGRSKEIMEMLENADKYLNKEYKG